MTQRTLICLDDDMPFEAQLLAKIQKYCHELGLLHFHEFGGNVTLAGFPDLVIAGDDEILFWELKSLTGTLNLMQETWRKRLRGDHRATYSVITPENWANGDVERTLLRLAGFEDVEAA